MYYTCKINDNYNVYLMSKHETYETAVIYLKNLAKKIIEEEYGKKNIEIAKVSSLDDIYSNHLSVGMYYYETVKDEIITIYICEKTLIVNKGIIWNSNNYIVKNRYTLKVAYYDEQFEYKEELSDDSSSDIKENQINLIEELKLEMENNNRRKKLGYSNDDEDSWDY